VTTPALCVFAKPPGPGAKTRLAAALGEARAATLAEAFLRDTWRLARSLPGVRPVLALTGPIHGGPAVAASDWWPQGDGDLGARLERVLGRALETNGPALAIGADTPGLPARLIHEAIDALAHVDAVLGPADDGGFYLIGLRACPPGLLARLPWSAPTTCVATHDRLRSRGLRVATLSRWFDVDTPADLARLGALLRQGIIEAPATAWALAHPHGAGGPAPPEDELPWASSRS
jgi:rSAM/selenodomain-associated transferase 1